MSRSADLRLQRTYYVPGFDFGLARYNELLEFQNGVCAVCKKPPGKIRLAVDHSHRTGEILGLLDMRCNRGYGLFVDGNIQRLLDAADYLMNPPAFKLWGRHLYTAPGCINTKKRAKLLAKMKGANG